MIIINVFRDYKSVFVGSDLNKNKNIYKLKKIFINKTEVLFLFSLMIFQFSSIIVITFLRYLSL